MGNSELIKLALALKKGVSRISDAGVESPLSFPLPLIDKLQFRISDLSV